MCKHSNVFSRPVLIGRGLGSNARVRYGVLKRRARPARGRLHRLKGFGGDSDEVTPVPIPNTEVKLISADGTWG